MNTDSAEAPPYEPPADPRKQLIRTLLLAGLSLVVMYLVFEILKPFFPVFSWALALGIVTFPLYSRFRTHIKSKSVCAFLAVVTVGVFILMPIGLILQQIAQESTQGFQAITELLEDGDLQRRVMRYVDKIPGVRQVAHSSALPRIVEGTATRLQGLLTQLVSTSFYGAIGLVLVLFALFFFFRDRSEIVALLRQLLPLSDKEATFLFARVRDTVYATVYGSFTVAAVQGILSGFMFWLVGMPTPLLWAVATAFIALVPYMGPFVIWIPAAVIFAFHGEYWKAALLTAWGGLVVGFIDNLLYPVLVGRQLRFHTLAVFFFVLGGIVFFGTSGIVLGPVVLAVADGLLELWQRRLGEPLAEQPRAV